MLIAAIILVGVLGWGGMFFLYYKPEITRWFDNRFGPDHVSKDQELEKERRKLKRLKRWLWYG